MITLNLYHYSEIIFGIIALWIGIYLVSRNPFSKLSWIAFGILFCFGIYVGTDPIYNIRVLSLENYILLQKILDPTLFFAPILIYHASLIIKNNASKMEKLYLYSGYIITTIICVLDFIGGFVVKEGEFRNVGFDYVFIFKPGPLLIPIVAYVFLYLIVSFANIASKIKEDFWKYFLLSLGIAIYITIDLFYGVSYYATIPYSMAIANVATAIGTFFIIFSIIKYHLFVDAGRIIFNQSFLYASISMMCILLIYTFSFFAVGYQYNYTALLYLNVLAILLLLSHSFFGWLSTFINDLVFNAGSGLSVVTDDEVSGVIKNYNSPNNLDDSSLLRLNIVNKAKANSGSMIPVDVLRGVVSEAIEYFHPDENSTERTKANLKYHLLKMIAYKQAEEGQILWELGFDEYPVRIMSRESKNRPPMFQTQSPSDYIYTSRNAYLALKREAIHDVTWRISYLEKLSKNRHN